jgi:hypothetical protein
VSRSPSVRARRRGATIKGVSSAAVALRGASQGYTGADHTESISRAARAPERERLIEATCTRLTKLPSSFSSSLCGCREATLKKKGEAKVVSGATDSHRSQLRLGGRVTTQHDGALVDVPDARNVPDLRSTNTNVQHSRQVWVPTSRCCKSEDWFRSARCRSVVAGARRARVVAEPVGPACGRGPTGRFRWGLTND